MQHEPDIHRLLIGKIAFRVFKANNQAILSEALSTEGTHTLDGFELEEILGFALALKEDPTTASRCEIRLHAPTFHAYDVPPEYLTNDGSVDIRNQDSDKTIVTPILPTTRKESFAHTDKTDIAAVTSNSAIDDYWIPTIIEHVGTTLLENSAKSFKALAKGVIRTSDTNISQAVHFLVETAKGIDASGSVASAAGQCLPILGLPRFKECFASIRADKINQSKAWEDVLKKHSQTRCYIKKQDAKSQPLSTESLIKKRDTLRNDDDFVIDTVVFDACDKYINAPHGESDETKNLLFNYDWSVVKAFFETPKNRITSSLSERTRTTLIGAGVTLPPEDGDILDLSRPRRNVRIDTLR